MRKLFAAYFIARAARAVLDTTPGTDGHAAARARLRDAEAAEAAAWTAAQAAAAQA